MKYIRCIKKLKMFFFQYIYWGCDWVVDKAEKWYENCASCLCTLLHQILYFWNSWLSFVPLVISYLQLGCWWPWPPYPASSMFFPARCPSWWLSITSWSSKWLIMMWIWPNQIPHSHSLAHCTCPNFVPLSKNFKALIRHEKNRELGNIIPGHILMKSKILDFLTKVVVCFLLRKSALNEYQFHYIQAWNTLILTLITLHLEDYSK